MLTRKQRDLLLFIHERMNGGDIAPSFEEMKEDPWPEIEIRRSPPDQRPGGTWLSGTPAAPCPRD